MTQRVEQGSWVEIERIVLQAGERAPQVPGDTQRVPLLLRARGTLLAEGVLGEVVDIESAAGRRLSGTLITANPPYDHSFGSPIPELTAIAAEVRALLAEGEV